MTLQELQTVLDRLSRQQLLDVIQQLATEQPDLAWRIAYHTNPETRVDLLWQRLSYFDLVMDNGYAHSWYEVNAFVEGLTAIMRDINRDILPNNPTAALDLTTALCHRESDILAYADKWNDFVFELLRQTIALWWKSAIVLRSSKTRPHVRWAIALERFVRKFPHAPFFAIAHLLLNEKEIKTLMRRAELRSTASSPNDSRDRARSLFQERCERTIETLQHILVSPQLPVPLPQRLATMSISDVEVWLEATRLKAVAAFKERRKLHANAELLELATRQSHGIKTT
jgi:hypothetical protein